MTEAQLLAKVESEGWEILQIQETGTEDDLVHKSVAACKVLNGVLDRRWFPYYVKGEDAYWAERDPFPVVVPVVTFRDELNTRIAELIAAASIKAAYVEKISNDDKTAIVVAITPANALKMYHVYKDAEGALLITELTGTYPI